MRSTGIDALKGLVIPLVIFGHYVPASSPPYWVWFAGTFIQGFHMDIFFLISGYLFGSRPLPATPDAGARFIGKKAKRLMVPFLSIAILFLALKLPSQMLFHMHTAVTPESVLDVLVNPKESYAAIIWFLETLFLIFSFFVLVHMLVRNKYAAAGLLMAVPLLLPFVEAPILRLVCMHVPAFCTGLFLSEFQKPALPDKTWGIVCALALLIAVVLVFQFGPLFMGPYIRTARALTLSLLALTCLQLLPGRVSELFGILGLYGSSIYLLHFPFASFVKKIVDQVLHAPESTFWLFAIPAFILATVMPVVLEQCILQKHPRLLFLLIGESPSDKGTRLGHALGLSPQYRVQGR